MADKGKLWLKLWTSILTDSKIANLSPCDFGKWVRLLLAVKLEGTNGVLEIESPALYLVNLLNDPDSAYEQTYKNMIHDIERLPGVSVTLRNAAVTESVTPENVTALHRVTVRFRNWDKYQAVSDPTNADRQKRYRENRKNERSRYVTDKKTVTVTGSPSVSISNPNRANPRAKSSPKEEILSFPEFWSWYPVHVARKQCEKKFSSLTEIQLHEIKDVMGLPQFIKITFGEFVPNPLTFLTGERWKDEPRKHEKKYDSAYGDYSSEEERQAKRKRELEELETFRSHQKE